MLSSTTPDAAGTPRPFLPLALAAFTLALLMGLQPVTTDVYLPALPVLRRALSATMDQAQLTMSTLILSFGVAQMVWGPVSDRVGRRPVLLVGLALYTVASLGCLLATSIEALIGWRIVQGAMLAAAVVCARAIIRDVYEPAQGAQAMAMALSGLGLIALVGPLMGGVTAQLMGWRGPLLLVALAGAATLAFVAWRLPETLRHRNREATRWRPLMRNWAEIAGNPVFVAWALLVTCAYGGLFTILAGSSFVYMDVLGLSSAAYGAAMAAGSLSYVAGTLLCRRSIARRGSQRTVALGAWLTLPAGLLMAGLATSGVQSVWAVLVPQCLFVFAHGLHQPCGQAGMVAPFPRNAGAAAALAGLVLALVAFGISRWLGVALDGSTRPLAHGVAFWSVCIAALAWGPVRRLKS